MDMITCFVIFICAGEIKMSRRSNSPSPNVEIKNLQDVSEGSPPADIPSQTGYSLPSALNSSMTSLICAVSGIESQSGIGNRRRDHIKVMKEAKTFEELSLKAMELLYSCTPTNVIPDVSGNNSNENNERK